MMSKESRSLRQSRRMKNVYKYANICKHLVLTQSENKEWVFKLDDLTKEQIDFIHERWCNGR